jgi:hypothetical protein
MVFVRLCSLLGTAALACAEITVPAGDARLYYSEQNWVRHNASLTSAVNAGAYLKLAFRSSASVSLLLQPPDATAVANASAAVQFMTVAYSVDNGERLLAPVWTNTSRLALASGLPADDSDARPHTLTLYIYNSRQGANRWADPANAGARAGALLVRGVALDDGAVALAPAALQLRPKRALFLGDSITEGVAAQCTWAPTCHAPKGSADLCANAGTKSWVHATAAAMQAEFSQVGFGGLGWVVGGGGGVPPLFTPGNDALSSWNKVYAGHARSFAGLDYIFVLHATNDGLRGAGGQDPGKVAEAAEGWLAAVRAAAGPTTAIFLAVPFGGFGGVNRPVGALKAAFDAYKASPSGQRDARTFFVDLGRDAAIGLECFGNDPTLIPAYGSRCGRSEAGCGGIHPRGGTTTIARDAELGAMLAVSATGALLGGKW